MAKNETTSGPKVAKVNNASGWCEVEFIKDFGSYKKGDKAVYHQSTIDALSKKEVLKVSKKIEKYVPKEAEK